jgi:hypothetical protein
VNLRPASPPVPLLFALLVLVAASARFGAQTLAELSGDAQATLWGLGAMWTALAGCGSWLLIMLVVAYVNLARPLTVTSAVTPEPVQMAQEVERVIYHPSGNDHEGWFLDASPEQWRAVYELTRTRNNIPFNYIDGKGRAFPTKESLNSFRTQLVGAGLAYVDKSNTVTLNAAGRKMVARYGSPTPTMNDRKQAVRATHTR